MKWCVSNEAHSPGFYKEGLVPTGAASKCTAIVCCNFMILQAVRRSMEESGKRVPEDYSRSASTTPAVTGEAGITAPCTCYQMGQQVGAACCG